MEEGYIYPRGFASKFSVYRAAVQAIPSGAWTQVMVDAQQFDILNEVDIIATSLFTPKQAGYYYIRGCIGYGILPIGTIIGIRLVYAGGTIAWKVKDTLGINREVVNISRLLWMQPTGTLQIGAYQNSGIAQNISNAHVDQNFEGFRIG